MYGPAVVLALQAGVSLCCKDGHASFAAALHMPAGIVAVNVDLPQVRVCKVLASAFKLLTWCWSLYH
jgi:hypothetical protein